MKCKDCTRTLNIATGFTTLKCGNLGTKSQPIANTPVYVYIMRNGIPEYTLRYSATSAVSTGIVTITIPAKDRDFFSPNLCYTLWMTLQTDNIGEKATFHVPNGGQGADVTCVALFFIATRDSDGTLVTIAAQDLIYTS